MKKLFFYIVLPVSLFYACKKSYDATPTFAKPAIAGTWAKQENFYAPRAEIYYDSIDTWRRFTAFSFTSEGDPDKISFANPYVPGKGTNALNMNTLYRTYPGLTSDSGYYNVTIIKCFQFIPKSADSTQEGSVVVLPQKLTLYDKDKNPFQIGIGPGAQPGTYNTRTGMFEIEVSFDESAIGGQRDKRRRYRFSS